jgi:hypothetical protein
VGLAINAACVFVLPGRTPSERTRNFMLAVAAGRGGARRLAAFSATGRVPGRSAGRTAAGVAGGAMAAAGGLRRVLLAAPRHHGGPERLRRLPQQRQASRAGAPDGGVGAPCAVLG